MGHESEANKSINKTTAGLWREFTNHRRRVTRLLQGVAAEIPEKNDSRTLCLLGAGNVNDVDLCELSTTYARIYLLDIDRDAVLAGVKRQTENALSITSKIVVCAPIDVSGIVRLQSLAGSTGADLSGIIAAFRDHSVPEEMTKLNVYAGVATDPKKFSVVASTCVASQVLRQANSLFARTNSEEWELAKIVRDAHIRNLLELTKDKGASVLITEVSGNMIAPVEVNALRFHEQVQGVADQLIQDGRYFAHLSPHEIRAFLKDRHGRGVEVRVIAPWLWTFSDKRYICYATVAKKR